jgi:FixJ family two-component response regulator/predicted Ser/Thr protein kinase
MTHKDGPAILIVDDEEAVLMLLGHQLAGLPCAIIPTSSAAEAIHILETREIAVLLSDLIMPGMDGNTVLSAAHARNANTVSIVVTGCADLSMAITAINEGGIWKYISKPWKRDDMVGLVKEGLARYQTLCRQQGALEKLARDITTDIFNQPTKAEAAEPAKPRWSGASVKKALRKIVKPRARAVGRESLASKRYKLVEVLGEGGMGTVYRAEDLLLGMPVAIKVLGSQLTRDEHAVSTLKEEARIAMQLSHRHIVRIHNLQKASGHYFLVMEFVKGRTFRDILERYGRLPADTVIQIVRVCADALAYAHRHRVLHRDLKPTNLMLSEDGVLKIIDFGVSCLVDAQRDAEEIIGTPVYMSPEHIRGETVDHRTDIYSLGIIAFQLLTGRNPYPQGATYRDILAMGPPKMSDLPDGIRQVLEKAAAPHRNERWPSAEAFATALTNAANPPS